MGQMEDEPQYMANVCNREMRATEEVYLQH